jgi:hypothetical protein
VKAVGPVPGQLVIGAAALGCLFLLMAAVAVLVVVCDRIARWVRQQPEQHDNPGALRLLEELDLHLDAYLLEHPEVREGFDRLRDAVDDEQRGEAS